ncbi:MAG: outer membrane lipoprotein LolB [Gammaproteobacteria bacterium]|nr:outer membrane lipoprotein LolB [Gammaproteobacteria bacterium]
MNRIRLHFISILIISGLVSACATKTPNEPHDNSWLERQQHISTIDNWTVKGRIGIKTPDQGFSSNLSWQHQPKQQLFRIYGAFGQTYAELNQSEDKSTLELSDNEIFESNDVESLLYHVLGYPLPIEHLEYWIFGLPYPGKNSVLSFDKIGHLQTIQYQQWEISYKKYKRFSSFDNQYLPTKIKVSNGDVTLRLSLRNWTMDSNL